MALPDGITVTAYPDGREVLHLGTLFDGTKPFHAGAYTYKGVNVTAHYWNAEWTYRSAPLAEKRTPAQIVAANRMFPLGDTGVSPGPYPGYKGYTGPMSPAWITIYMPTTGERPDIGLLTDPSARFMLGQSPDGMFAAAQAAGSFPVHFRDEKTGKPVNLLTYPQGNCYSNPGQGSPYFPPWPLDATGQPNPGGGLVPQQAHFCEMSYIAYQATGDLGLLKDIQDSATFCIMADASKSSPKAAILAGEYRGFAWGWREIFMAHTATLDAEVAGAVMADYGLHDSTYWKQILDNQLAAALPYMSDPTNQVFRMVRGIGGFFTPWQMDYMLTVLAFAVLTGHTEWNAYYLWALKNVIDRTFWDGSKNRGYPMGMGGGRYYDSKQPSWAATVKNMYDTAITGDGFQPADTRFTQAQYNTLLADPMQNYTTIYDGSYHHTTRAVLVMAQYLHAKGLVDVKSLYPELDQCFINTDKYIQKGGWISPRHSYIQASGGIIMPSAVSVNLGQKVHLDVAFTGPKPPAAPTYTQSDGTIGSLTAPDMSGVLFTSAKVGKTIVTAATTGVSGPISDTCEVTVNSPLPTGITLTPGTVS